MKTERRYGERVRAVLEALSAVDAGKIFAIADLGLGKGSRSAPHRVFGVAQCVEAFALLPIEGGGPKKTWKKLPPPHNCLDCPFGSGRSVQCPSWDKGDDFLPLG